MVYPIAKKTFFPLIRLFIKKVEGFENIPKQKRFIIASNHEALLDPLLIGTVIIPYINKKIHYIARKSKYWYLFGNTISTKWAGCVPYEKGKEKVSYEHSKKLIENNEVIGIFPTGIRNPEGVFTKAKTGAVRLAIETKTQILPAGIIYEKHPKEKIFPKFKSAVIKFGKPIYYTKHYDKEIDYKTLEKLTRELMLKIAKLAIERQAY